MFAFVIEYSSGNCFMMYDENYRLKLMKLTINVQWKFTQRNSRSLL